MMGCVVFSNPGPTQFYSLLCHKPSKTIPFFTASWLHAIYISIYVFRSHTYILEFFKKPYYFSITDQLLTQIWIHFRVIRILCTKLTGDMSHKQEHFLYASLVLLKCFNKYHDCFSNIRAKVIMSHCLSYIAAYREQILSTKITKKKHDVNQKRIKSFLLGLTIIFANLEHIVPSCKVRKHAYYLEDANNGLNC